MQYASLTSTKMQQQTEQTILHLVKGFKLQIEMKMTLKFKVQLKLTLECSMSWKSTSFTERTWSPSCKPALWASESGTTCQHTKQTFHLWTERQTIRQNIRVE